MSIADCLETRGQLLRNYSQNLDGLELFAGIERYVPCHGNLAGASCLACRAKVQPATFYAAVSAMVSAALETFSILEARESIRAEEAVMKVVTASVSAAIFASVPDAAAGWAGADCGIGSGGRVDDEVEDDGVGRH